MARVLKALIIFSLVIISSAADNNTTAPSCSTVDGQVNPCVSYITGSLMAGPSDTCCAGIRGIAGEVHGKQDLVAICNCVKNLLIGLGSKVIAGRISELPSKCGIPVNLPPINKDYDCNKVGSDINM